MIKDNEIFGLREDKKDLNVFVPEKKQQRKKERFRIREQGWKRMVFKAQKLASEEISISSWDKVKLKEKEFRC
jgi:hypothetical protein